MKNFPLNSCVPAQRCNLFSKTNLPLNIFEERYLNLVNDAHKKDKLMGMVQSKKVVMRFIKLDALEKLASYKEVGMANSY